MRVILIVLLFCFWTSGGLFAQAQKQTEQVEQIWIGYFNQTRLSKRWGAWLDVQLRTKDHFTDSLSQFLFRPGVTYYIDDKTKLTLGYAFINHFPADNHRKLRTMQWFRLEERFRRKVKDADELAEGYNFNFRIRYNFLIQGPITRKMYDKGALNWVFNDELHINFGKEIVYNYFDQNRLFLGFNYYLTKNNTLQFGYMNLFQQLSSGNKYKSIHTARIFFFHNLSF
jgi:hypothetical protein